MNAIKISSTMKQVTRDHMPKIGDKLISGHKCWSDHTLSSPCVVPVTKVTATTVNGYWKYRRSNDMLEDRHGHTLWYASDKDFVTVEHIVATEKAKKAAEAKKEQERQQKIKQERRQKVEAYWTLEGKERWETAQVLKTAVGPVKMINLRTQRGDFRTFFVDIRDRKDWEGKPEHMMCVASIHMSNWDRDNGQLFNSTSHSQQKVEDEKEAMYEMWRD